MLRLTRFLLMLLMLVTLSMTVLSAQEAPFTLQADADLQPALTALHAAFYDSEPVFVDADADLMATTDRANLPADFAGVAPHFLPEAFFIPQADSPEAAAFVAFAVSPDGQQALIDAGFLPDSVTLIDQTGTEVVIPQPVRRVVSPYSLATYLVYGVNAADRLVAGGYLGARDPIGAARMEAIDPRFAELSGYTMNQREINIEQLALLMPDVIFTSSRSAWLDTVAELGIPVVLFEGEAPELLVQAMLIAGQVLGPNAAAHADAWATDYDAVLAQVTEATADLSEEERPRVLMVGEEPLRVISGDMYQTDIIAAAGGQSVSADLTGFWNDVNLEQIALWAPDVIIIVPYGNVTPETLTDDESWQIIPAVQNGQVYKMPSWVAPWDAPVPDSLLGIIWLAQTLFPERLDLDCTTAALAFFETYYNTTLPADGVAAVCGA